MGSLQAANPIAAAFLQKIGAGIWPTEALFDFAFFTEDRASPVRAVIAQVPEPASMLVVGAGLLGAAAVGMRLSRRC